MSFVTKENTQDIYPLSPTQKGMLFHSLYDTASPVYFEQTAFTINGPLNITAFQAAWDHLARITPVFKTVFKWAKVKKPLQIVLKHLPVALEVHDLKGLEEKDQIHAITSFQKSDKATPFDLEEGPLIRLNLFALKETRHRLIWSYHHLILDGWCMSIILKDIFEMYLAALAGKPMPMPERRPYKDYIAWCLEKDPDAAATFWKEQLGDFDTPTPLPLDRRPGRSLEKGIGEERLNLTEEMTVRLQQVTSKEHLTLSTALQSAWAILLSCYTDTEDIVFGFTSSGRPSDLKGSDTMLGLFINTLPLRVRFLPDMPALEVMKSIQSAAISIREYEYSFLPEIKECSAISRAQNLFDSIVVFENYPLDAFLMAEGDDFGITDIQTNEMTNFALTLVIVPEKGLSLRLQYEKALFDHKTIRRMLRHLENILSAIIQAPSTHVSRVDILSPAEKHQLLVEFNNTDAGYPTHETLQGLFEAQVERTPDHTALVFENRRIPYADLNQKANQLARRLKEEGVQREDIVAIIADRSIEMVIAIIAILKAGGAYLPIEPDFPQERIDFMLQDSGAKLLLTTKDLTGKTGCIPDKILIDDDGIYQGDGTNLKNASAPKDLAYIIYTSGTTGKPKGVMIEHRNVVRLLFNGENRFDFSRQDVWTLFHSYAFDFSVWEMYGALLYGGKLIVISKAVARDPGQFLQVIKAEKATILNQTPSAFYNLIDAELDQPEPGLTIRNVIFGGEALKPAKLSEWKRRYPECKLINMYGITETTVHVTYKEIGTREIASNISNIGVPIPTLRTYVMDKHQRLLPVGIPGELCVGGEGVGRGYLNRPELTEIKFIDNPYKPGERLYRSGDLVKLTHTGEMEYLGRIDHQVKIRGFRIELGEIENRLLFHENIAEALVIAKESENGAPYLAAYIVREPSTAQDTRAAISVARLREFLSKALPDYMIPAYFKALDKMPLTPNGKVDRKALPDVVGARSELAGEYVSPTTELEEILVQVWREVLNIDKVGIFDNFFDLGGDSIISLQVVGRVKKLGYELQPKDIFENQTIAELAPRMTRFHAVEAEQGIVVGDAALTPIQRWFFSLGLANENHFNQTLIFHSDIPVDTEALRNSLNALVEHHDALRMRFSENRQHCMPPVGSIALTVKDLTGNAALLDEVNALQQSFNLTTGPLFGAGLYRKDGVNYLAFSANHLVMDGVSWRILLEDFLLAYGAAVNGTAIALPAKTTSYKEWAEKLAQYAKETPSDAGYWETEASADVPELPTDHDLGVNDIASSAVIQLSLSETDTGFLLREAHKAYNTEVTDLLLTALMRALSGWTSHDTVTIELEGHGREDVIGGVDITRTVGWFTTIFPVVLSSGEKSSIEAQIKYVKEKLRNVPQKGFNYGVLKYLKSGTLIYESSPQVLFNYLGQIDAGFNTFFKLAEETRSVRVSDPRNKRSHLIDVSCRIETAKLKVDIVYSRNKFKDATLQSFGKTLEAEIKRIIDCCMGLDREGYTPSDFELTDISQDQLDSLMDDIEDI